MAVVDGFDDLAEDVSALVFFEVLVLDDAVEELAALADPGLSRSLLDDQVHVFFIFEEIIESEDVRVVLREVGLRDSS